MDSEVLVAIITSLIAFIEATGSIIWNHFTKKKILKMEQSHAKEMEELKKNNSIDIIKFENEETRTFDYEKQRYEAITNYLESAGAFLSNVYSTDNYSSFNKAIAKIFMYIPEKYHSKINVFNNELFNIENIKYENNYEKLTFYTSKAEKSYTALCSDFSEFKLKHKTPTPR